MMHGHWTQDEFTLKRQPLEDYLRQCPIPLSDEQVGAMLRSINAVNIECNMTREDRVRDARRVAELHDEGCFLGDVARTDVDEMTPHDEDILTAVTETALTLGHRFIDQFTEDDHG